ncbi:MAG: Npun_F0494 family protein [Cyanobacteria bacterium P01_H01_bin.15]
MVPTAKPPEKVDYTNLAYRRGERALQCSPFQLTLFIAMRQGQVLLSAIVGKSGVDRSFTIQALSEPQAETQLMWLIKVGLLRREVDGQGITDSFRLTPLGRQVVARWENEPQGLPTANLAAKISNSGCRWLRLPI